MLHTSASPFNNSFTRQETDLVVQTMRKNSLETSVQSISSATLEDRKEVNISNLSDLIPEEPLPEQDSEDIYTRLMRPGELNEVTEVEESDEDVSDDPMTSPRQENLPSHIHTRINSAVILGTKHSNTQFT